MKAVGEDRDDGAGISMTSRPATTKVKQYGARKLKDQLDEKGYAVIPGATPKPLLERMVTEVRAVCGRSLFDPAFNGVPLYGDRIRRGFDLVGKSPALLKALALPMIEMVNEAILLDWCDHALLSAATALDVYEQQGAQQQPLHRDEEVYPTYLPRTPLGPEYTYNIMIAGTDFTAENGATRIVPGSHLWPRERRVTPQDEVISLTMKKGDWGIWLGSTFHGAGINVTADPRLGIILGFSSGWLRTLENQFLLLDAETVARQPRKVQQYLGWDSHGIVGQHNWRPPHEALATVKTPLHAH